MHHKRKSLERQYEKEVLNEHIKKGYNLSKDVFKCNK